MSTATSSYSSLESWTDDEDYVTFDRPSQKKDVTFLREDSPQLEAVKLVVKSEFTEEMEPIYENLDRRGTDAVVIYGQFLRTQLGQMKDKRKKECLIEKILDLFNLSSNLLHSTDHITMKVEEELARILDKNPTCFRETAEAMCSLLQSTKQESPSRFMSLRKGLQKFFRNK